MTHKYLHTFLILVAFILFIPGILQPMLSLQMDAHIDAQFLQKKFTLFSASHSIIGTMKELWKYGAWGATILIFVFSIINPIVKTCIFLVCLYLEESKIKKKLLIFLAFMSKWSFADVLTIAILIAYLSAARNPQVIEESIQVMGLGLPLKISMPMLADFGTGFYCFAGFCFLSNISISIFMLGSQLNKLEADSPFVTK